MHRGQATVRGHLQVAADLVGDLSEVSIGTGCSPHRPVADAAPPPDAVGVPRSAGSDHAVSSSPQGPFLLGCVGVANPGRIRPFPYPEAESAKRHAWWRASPSASTPNRTPPNQTSRSKQVKTQAYNRRCTSGVSCEFPHFAVAARAVVSVGLTVYGTGRSL
jgi:hypothetical protein